MDNSFPCGLYRKGVYFSRESILGFFFYTIFYRPSENSTRLFLSSSSLILNFPILILRLPQKRTLDFFLLWVYYGG